MYALNIILVLISIPLLSFGIWSENIVENFNCIEDSNQMKSQFESIEKCEEWKTNELPNMGTMNIIMMITLFLLIMFLPFTYRMAKIKYDNKKSYKGYDPEDMK